MTKRNTAYTLLFSAVALALSACSDQRQEPTQKAAAQTEEVRNVEAAKAQFLKERDWSKRPEAFAAVHGKLLNTNDVIGEIGGEVVHHAPEFEWFAVIDYAPGAYFRHPLTYSFLSYDEGSLSQAHSTQLPTVNYENAWARYSDFLNDPHVVYDKSWLTGDTLRTAEAIVSLRPANWPPRMVTDRCKNEKRAYAVLIHNIENLDTSPETKENLTMMAAALEANGYHVQGFKSNVTGEKEPYLELSSPKGNGIYQLLNYVNIHVDFNDCCEEVLVYITGETSVKKDGYMERVTLDLPFGYEGYDQSRKPAKNFYPEDFALIFDQIKTCHLNFIIDTNNASGFASDLLRIPNTESVLSSCQVNEYTYSSGVETLGGGSFVDPFGLDDGEKGSEFTSSVAKALFETASLRQDNEIPSHAADLMQAAFESVKLNDLGFLGGVSTPELEGRTMSSNCPCGLDTELTRY